MATITKPKPPITLFAKHGGNKKFHTLHMYKDIFTVQKDGTSIVAFRNKNDAVRFGKLLESHYELTRAWPVVNFEDVLLYKPSKVNKLQFLEVKEWHNDSLRNFCIEYYFNMLDIHSVEDEYRLVGNSIRWDVPMNMYIDMLNERLL